jgi:DNA-binding winged helix-turn-helix (wHTH) protein
MAWRIIRHSVVDLQQARRHSASPAPGTRQHLRKCECREAAETSEITFLPCYRVALSNSTPKAPKMPRQTTRFGSLEIDYALFEIRRNGKPVHLEKRVFDLVAYLIRHRGRVVSKDELRRTVWKGKPVVDASVTVAVAQARRVLGDERRVLIRTHSGRGYSFQAPTAKR